MARAQKSNYRITPKAQNDLEEIWLFTAEKWTAHQADIYVGAIIDSIESLSDTPERGRMIDVVRPGYRKLLSGSHFIFYRLINSQVEIVRVLHEKMDVEAHFQG